MILSFSFLCECETSLFPLSLSLLFLLRHREKMAMFLCKEWEIVLNEWEKVVWLVGSGSRNIFRGSHRKWLLQHIRILKGAEKKLVNQRTIFACLFFPFFFPTYFFSSVPLRLGTSFNVSGCVFRLSSSSPLQFFG